MHYAQHGRGRFSGYGEGETEELARRAAIIDAADRPALEEAPFRPGTATILGGIAAVGFSLLGVVALLFS